MPEFSRLSRGDKLTVARSIDERLQKRIDDGAPDDPALNAYQAEVKAVVVKLDTHQSGAVAVNAARATLVARSEESDDDVDCCCRKFHGYFTAESLRRTGARGARARGLLKAAFPSGLSLIDDRIVDENNACRDAIKVLRAPENAESMAAIEVPAGWVDQFEAAVAKSDADYAALASGRSQKASHIDMAQDAEEEWEDVMARLRHHIASRAKRGETAKQIEGREILDPLLNAIKKMRADAETRATLRAKKANGAAEAPEAKANPEPTPEATP